MTDCVICLLDFQDDAEIIVLPCEVKHYFHKQCGIDWMQRKTECPLCRKDFSDDIIKHVKTNNQRLTQIIEADPANLAHGINPDEERRRSSNESNDLESDNEQDEDVR